MLMLVLMLVLVLERRGVRDHGMEAGKIRYEVADYSCHLIVIKRKAAGSNEEARGGYYEELDWLVSTVTATATAK